VQAVGMIGVDCQNLAIEPFGFGQSSALMMAKGISKRILNGR
jgi:hypothetical protein